MLPNSFQKKEKGIALITSLLFLMLLSISWFTFSFFTSDEEGVIQNQIDSDQAAYLAEAGIQQALWFLSQDWNWQNWTDNKWGNGGTRVTDGSLIYYEWSGNLGDTAQAYTVQIRNDGQIQSKIKVGSPNLNNPKRIIEVELGSAFDYGLYSHEDMGFSSGSFTVSGANQKGYVYAKDPITGSGLLTADKITGNYESAPWFLPKEIPLPELWHTRNPQTGTWVGFEAKINGTPTSTTVLYNNDTGEAKLEVGALLQNKTLATRVTSGIFFRKITGFNIATNTITTENSPGDGWAAGDKIVVERIEVYENYWNNTLIPQLNNLNSASYATNGSPSLSPSPFQSQQSFSNTNFINTPTVQFYGNTIFSGNIKINGNAILGRRHQYFFIFYSGRTTINGNMVINGNAYFFNQVNINGQLYVTGSVYMWDQNSYNWICSGCGSGGSDIIVNETSPGIHGIAIATGGGLFVRDGIFTINKEIADGGLNINDYCYVNGGVTINNVTGAPLMAGIPTTPREKALYIKNGSLNVAQDINGRGKIIISQNVTIGNDLLAPVSNNPLFIAAGGDLSIGRYLGASGNPFYGLIYAGENTAIGSSINIGGGGIITNNFSSPLNGGSITYRDFKGQLNDMGFSNNRDFVRPLLWRETD
ncbi:MAG: pilus assembly PilX N-terminal domain-containing protein [Pseudomonadota bacterium]